MFNANLETKVEFKMHSQSDSESCYKCKNLIKKYIYTFVGFCKVVNIFGQM